MLIPSIDLKNGQVVQLIQGERPALATDDVEAWVRKFQPFPKVQLIDLDAAMGSGTNDALVREVRNQMLLECILLGHQFCHILRQVGKNNRGAVRFQKRGVTHASRRARQPRGKLPFS